MQPLGLSNASRAGVAIFVGTVQFSLILIVSEIVYSTSGPLNTSGSGNESGYVYSVANNYVSDLGANCRTTCTTVPSAYLFDFSIALLGLLILVGAFYLNRAYHWRPATVMIALAGVGALGVGLFPETTGIWHSLFSLVVFLFSGLTAIVTARFQKRPHVLPLGHSGPCHARRPLAVHRRRLSRARTGRDGEDGGLSGACLVPGLRRASDVRGRNPEDVTSGKDVFM